MDKLKPRAIIFDLGSTLIEYESMPWDELGVACLEAGRQFLLNKGYDLPDRQTVQNIFYEIRDDYRREATESLIEWDVPTVTSRMFDALTIQYDDDLLDSFFDAYYEPIDRELFIYDDVLETLEILRATYPMMGLVSNTVFPERAHHMELQRFGIEPYLSFAIFSSTFGLRKPHPDIFYHACNLAGFAPSECLYVGDRYVEDVTGPVGIGMKAILKIKPGREYPDDMPDSLRKIDSLSELLDHLER
ncbi:MAG: HAD family hydrolase [candidate division Zixibacteria bacterium]|nr:HAD family hydrolase [candidate division Zixibacteria bacterium]